MWRISFNPKVSRFVVQLLKFGCVWVSCESTLSEEVLYFETHKEARSWVRSIGLDRLYPEQESKVVYNARCDAYSNELSQPLLD